MRKYKLFVEAEFNLPIWLQDLDLKQLESSTTIDLIDKYEEEINVYKYQLAVELFGVSTGETASMANIKNIKVIEITK